ncbi:MAG: hypothetical protein ABH851_04830 [Methanobacteriota archaeon]
MLREQTRSKGAPRFYPSEKKPGDIEKVKATLTAHKTQIDAILKSSSASGTEGAVEFKRSSDGNEVDWCVYGLGKQQPVWFLNLKLPDGMTCDLVEKQRRGGEEKAALAEEYPIVGGIFPPIVYAGEQGYLMARLDGLGGSHLKINEFKNAITESEEFKTQLFSDAYEMVDGIFKDTPYCVVDVGVPEGHNIMYDRDLEKFRLFDYDSLVVRPEEGYAEKHLRFISEQCNEYRTANDRDIEFLIYYVNRLTRENPNIKLEKTIPRKEYAPGHPGYHNAYVCEYGALPKGDGTIVITGGYTQSIHPEIERAIQEEDASTIRAFIDSNVNQNRILRKDDL